MTNSPDRHLPHPAFRVELEHEVARAWRRESRLAASPPPRRWFATPALVRLVLALGIGLVAGAAPAQVQEVQQRRHLLEAAETEVQLATVRMQLVLEEVENVRKQVAAGVQSREALVAAEAKLRGAQARVQAARLNVEEIRATSAQPRDDLSAPVVQRRDFVRERLMLELQVADLEAQTARQRMEQTARRHQMGAISDLELQAARAELEQAMLRTRLLTERMGLRHRVVEEGIGPTEVERQARHMELRNNVEFLNMQMQLARQRLAAVSERHERGAVPRSDLLRAELEMLELQAQLAQVERELRAIMSRPPDGA